MSVVTSAPGVLDPYNIEGLHSKFRGFPKAEKQSNITTLNVAAMVGGGSNGFDLTQGQPQKWWFVSEDDGRVIQIQDDFFSYNWRRIGVNFGDEFDYPGFGRIIKEFEENLNRLKDWHSDKKTVLPDPSGCELYYDDIIPLQRSDGSTFGLSEALTELDRVEKNRLVAAWSNSWFESIDQTNDDSQSTLRIEISSIGMFNKADLKPIPVLRIIWCAGAARSTWEDVIKFFGIAHDHILKRFNLLISEEVQATWS